MSLFGHIKDTSRGTDDELNAGSELLNVIANDGSTDACVAADAHVLTKTSTDRHDLLSELTSRGQDQSLGDLLGGVDALEAANGEGAGLTGTRLGLADSVSTKDQGSDGALLDSGRLLETIRVDTSQKVFVQVQVIEGLTNFVLEVVLSAHLKVVLKGKIRDGLIHAGVFE